AVEISNKRSASAVQMHSKRRGFASGLHMQMHTHSQSHSHKERGMNGFQQEEVKSSITPGFSAYPESEEFKKWKTWAFEHNVPLWRELQKRETENRSFDVESQWPQ